MRWRAAVCRWAVARLVGLGALALFVPSAAWAAPVIPIFIAMMAAYTGIIAMSTAVFIIVSTIYGAYRKRAAERDARRAFNQAQRDRVSMVRSAAEPRQILVGRDRVSGPLAYLDSTGDKKQYLHMVVALGGHVYDGLETVYFGDEALPEPDANGFIQSGKFYRVGKLVVHSLVTTVAATSVQVPTPNEGVVEVWWDTSQIGQGDNGPGALLPPSEYTVSGNTITMVSSEPRYFDVKYNVREGHGPVVRIHKYNGEQTVADPDLVAETGGRWTAAHVGYGVPYIYVRLEYDTDVFRNVGVPNVSVVCRGARLYDPRTNTMAWGDNAALALAWWMREPVVGPGVAPDELPDSELAAEANVCDELVALQAGTERRYTCNGTVRTDMARLDILEALLTGMAGSACWVQGRWLVRAGVYEVPEFILDASCLAQGDLRIMPRIPRRDLYNEVSGIYTDAASGYIERQQQPVTNPAYLAQDGGVRWPKTDLEHPMVRDGVRAQRMAKIELERIRGAMSVTLTCNLKVYGVQPGQTIYLHLPRYQINMRAMLITGREYVPAERRIRLALIETKASMYAWNWTEATPVSAAP